MTYLPSQQAYGVAVGTTPTQNHVYRPRAPTSNDVLYPIGQFWNDTAHQTLWYLASQSSPGGNLQSNWQELTQGGATAIETLTGNTGGAVGPTSGNVNIKGDGTYLTVTGNSATSTLTVEPLGALATTYDGNTGSAIASGGILNIEATFVASGSVPVTTTASGNTVTTEIQVSQAIASTGATKIGLAAFNSTDFTVDANGFVSLVGTGTGAIQKVNNQVFTTTGTYTPTSGMVYCSIQAIGGGAAGGGAPSTSSSQAAAGGSGGAGEYAVGIFSAATIGASKAVTIGAAGVGVSNAAGGNGGTTSVGSLITAFGGTGGNAGVAEALCIVTDGGAGGTGGAGGDYRTPGVPGAWGIVALISTGYIAVGGTGASSQLGSGGSVGVGAGLPASGYGSGGGGSSNIPSTVSNTAGGNGSAGIVVITEYIA